MSCFLQAKDFQFIVIEEEGNQKLITFKIPESESFFFFFFTFSDLKVAQTF